MREESHLDDMRAAIRGDFERLAERRGAQELMQEPTAPPETAPDERPELAAELDEEEGAPASEPEAAALSQDEVEEPRRKGFFARLLDL